MVPIWVSLSFVEIVLSSLKHWSESTTKVVTRFFGGGRESGAWNGHSLCKARNTSRTRTGMERMKCGPRPRLYLLDDATFLHRC
jgi:hypothetical protein